MKNQTQSAPKWNVAIRVRGSLRPLHSFNFPDQDSADQYAAHVRAEVARNGWTHRVDVAPVIENQAVQS